MKRIKSKLEVLTQDELLLIHTSAVKILNEIGMRVPNGDVLEKCRAHGLTANDASQTIRFPSIIIEEFLEDMRKGSKDKPTDEAQPLAGWISTQITLVDNAAQTRRYGLRDDNLKCIKLVESLGNIPAANAGVVPSDVPYDIADAVTTADILKYSTKPGGTYILTPTGAKYISRINKLFGRRSNYLLETISPLTFKADTLEMAVAFAQEGGGLSIAPMAMSSATAPATIAGCLTLETAEVLGSGFIAYVLTGEFPGFAASCHSSDPRTMLCSFGSPNQALFAVACGQLARFYGIQGGCNTALTDALTPDFQGGFEKGVTAAFNSIAGLKSIGCQGIVGADQGFSFEQLVIDNEWIDYYNYITRGFEVTEETIGLSVIRDVGIAGNFLSEEHTAEYIRKNYWFSNLFNRNDWSNWLAGGGKNIYTRAHEYVETVTAGYQNMEPVIAPSLCAQLDEIIREAYLEMNAPKPVT